MIALIDINMPSHRHQYFEYIGKHQNYYFLQRNELKSPFFTKKYAKIFIYAEE